MCIKFQEIDQGLNSGSSLRQSRDALALPDQVVKVGLLRPRSAVLGNNKTEP
jgi:hypothetical protein